MATHLKYSEAVLSRLLLVRHGITEYNSSLKFAGSTDIDMSPDGYQQVEKLRDRLQKEKIDAVFCSSLKRARRSAEVIANGHDVEITAIPDLREVDYGHAEGLTFDEITRHYPEIAELMVNRSLQISFPGGDGFAELEERIKRFIDKLKQFTPEQTVLVVSHGGPLRALVCLLLEMGLQCWWRLRFDNASLSIVETYPHGAILNLLNDVSHLEVATG